MAEFERCYTTDRRMPVSRGSGPSRPEKSGDEDK